ncbi:related to FRE3 - Ferric reductase, reduces siderophore-bound iron prior to uptake [Ustilago trichophora]|uniref:Related to FRE3 - Ferric reductase, reduces siderophore-bound iron prior to uptake n=1 Tax=Ustilago trichophora TaxID=86804 RepID=A0A5C3ELU6_9BASI|nr:related to FRE3 - Ferric reductase, reduces siderophore-bound iron prior to uptake [Ustilago trichophora]
MIPNPWTMSPKQLKYINALPPDQQGPAFVAYQGYYYNSMKVPCFAAFAMYGLFVLLIFAAACRNLLAWKSPALHRRINRKLQWIRAHLWEHPLLSRNHATLVSLPGLRWLTLQLPLRSEALVILGLFLINLVPLVAFYKLLDPIAGSKLIRSRSAQVCRALADRTGVLGTAQLPLLILMATKRTPLAIVSGLGQNSLMLYHRWIARWFWTHIFIHGVSYSVVYASRPNGLKEMLAETYIRWGIVGLAMAFGLVFLSLRSLRQSYYEVFVMLHMVMAIFAILGTYLHIALIEYGPYTIFKMMTELAAAFWAFDRVVRWVSRVYLTFSFESRSNVSSEKGSSVIKCASAQIRAFSAAADYTRLRISVPASKLRLADQPQPLIQGIAAGDDIRVTIPRLQWLGEHPFTVFAAGTFDDEPSQGYIDLLIKTEGGLTRKLAKHAVRSSKTCKADNDVELAGAPPNPLEMSVLIEGPFGTVPEISKGTTDLVLVAGGIAITFCWPLFVAAFKSCLTKAGKPKLATCKLVWILRHESTLALLEEAFLDLVQQVQGEHDLTGCHFTMDIYVTSTVSQALHSSSASNSIKEHADEAGSLHHEKVLTSVGKDDIILEAEVPALSHTESGNSDEEQQAKLFWDGVKGDAVKVCRFFGRPKSLSLSLFGHLDKEQLVRERDQALTVAFCGPSSLCDDIRYEAVGLLKKGIPVELVEECFTW